MMKSFLFLLSIIGCCVGQDLLPEGPVSEDFKKNVTFRTLINLKDDFINFVWYFNRGSRLVPIVTVTPAGVTVGEDYQGRAWVNRTNGFLTLGPLEGNDRGYYIATMVTSKMNKTEEIMLRVLGCCELKALPEGPVEAVSGESVTLKTLTDPKEDIIKMTWAFGNQHVALVERDQETVVFEGFQGRVTVNQTNGFLTLGPLATTDSGNYLFTIQTAKNWMTGDTNLQVLDPPSSLTPPTQPGLPEEEEKGGELRTTPSHTPTSLYTTASPHSTTFPYTTSSQHTTTSPHSTTSPHTTTAPHTTTPSRTTTSPYDTTSSHTTTSPYDTTSSHTTTSPYDTTSSHTTTSPYDTTSSHTTTFPCDTTSSHTTTSPYDTTSSHTTTTWKDRDTIHTWFEKLQQELGEMKLSFERSLRQMESRTHGLLWSMTRRLERISDAVNQNSGSSHQAKSHISFSHLLSRGASAVTPSSQPPGSRLMSLQRRRGGKNPS